MWGKRLKTALGLKKPVPEELRDARRAAAMEEVKAIGSWVDEGVEGKIVESLSAAYANADVPVYIKLMVRQSDGLVLMDIRETADDELEQVWFTIPRRALPSLELKKKAPPRWRGRPDLASPPKKKPPPVRAGASKGGRKV